MPKWSDSRVEESVKGELADLQEVVAVISQLPKGTARRILDYCYSYINDGEKEIPPFASEQVSKLLKKHLDAQK